MGHKWVADSDSKLRERVQKWLAVPEDPAHLEESLYNLVKEIEDQAWMRLSSARTKHWNELEELLGVKGGSDVVQAVRELISSEHELKEMQEQVRKFSPPEES